MSEPTVRDRLDELPDVVLVGGYIVAIWLTMVVLARVVGGSQWPNLAAGFVGSVTVLIGAYAVLTLALNLQWGYTGLFNIGVAGFMAVGAYTMAILTAPVDPGAGGVPGFGLPLVVGVVGGMVVAAVVGGLAALPALRLKADYLAIVTVALSEIIRLFVNWSGVAEITLFGATFGTGGATGISFEAPDDVVAGLVTGVGSPLVAAGEAVGVSSPNLVNIAYGLALLAVVAGAYWVLTRLSNSPFGRVLKAIREDETVTQSLGKDTRLFKIKAFMIGCALMGLAGILFRGGAGYISPAVPSRHHVLRVRGAHHRRVWVEHGQHPRGGDVLGAALLSPGADRREHPAGWRRVGGQHRRGRRRTRLAGPDALRRVYGREHQHAPVRPHRRRPHLHHPEPAQGAARSPERTRSER